MRRILALLAIAVCARAVEPVTPSGFVVGVCTHFSQGKGLLPVNLSLIRQAGANALRDETGWNRLESVKGQLKMPDEWDAFVRRAAAMGIRPLLILDYGNRFYDNGDKPLSGEALEGFARYSEFVVRHFKGVVHDYEVWNEYDIRIGGTSPGSAEDYARMLRKVYPRIKAVDPSITVYGGAMTSGGIDKGWLESMLAAGALADLDVVSIHSYNHLEPGRGHTPEAWAEWTRKVEETVRKHNGGKAAPLAVSEMGWPTQSDKFGATPQAAADYLARMFLLGRGMPFLKGIWWYDFQDDGWNSTDAENNFGMVRPDLTPKPAYFALAGIAEAMQADPMGRVDAGDPDVYVLKFRGAAKDIWAIWSAHEDGDWQVTLKTAAANPKALSVAKVGARPFEREWGGRDWPGVRGARAVPDEMSLTVRGTPWLLSGDLSAVTVVKATPR